MSLRYIFGKTGSGKTALCIKEITEKDNIDNTLLYIVPEQFSMESERLLVSANKKGTIMNTSVFSFRHLAYHLIGKFGSRGRAMLDDVSKAMLVRKIAYSLGDKLVFFGRSIDKQGFIDELCDTIGELMHYSITPAMIMTAIESMEEGNLKMKLSDILLIYESYTEYLEKDYISKDDMLDILAEYIAESGICNDEIWIDGFMGFTPQEYKVIEKLLQCAKRVNITLDINSSRISYSDIDPFDPFYKTKHTVNRLTRLAGEIGVNIERPLYLSGNYRQRDKALKHLSENYLSYVPPKYSEKTDRIQIYKGTDKYSEIDHVCRNVVKLVRDKGWYYRDIAVITGSSDYEIPLCHSLNKYGIPNFLDQRRSIMSHPFTEFVLSATDTAALGFGHIFRLLKTGYADIDEEDVFEIENYVIANGIKGHMWKQEEWKYGFYERSPFDHDRINSIKDHILNILSPLTDNIRPGKKYSVREITQRLFEFIKISGAEEVHSDIIAKNQEDNDIALADINTGVWNTIAETLEKVVNILGDEMVTAKEYAKIVRSGLSAATIGVVPALQDMLIVGNIGRTILPDVKAVFMLGVNEGCVPAYRETRGIFNDGEREYLSANAFEVAPDSTQEINSERFEIYSCLAKPSEYLCLSYAAGNIRGEGLTASPVIFKVLDIFENMEVYPIEDKLSDIKDITAKEPAFDSLIAEISEGGGLSPLYRGIYNYFMKDEYYSSRLETVVRGIAEQSDIEYLNEKITNSIYPESIYSSISRLESFAKCPYSFFMKYIIKAEERAVYDIKPRDAGNLYHYVLEDFSKHLRENNTDWRSLDDSSISDIIDKSVDSITADMGTDILTSTARYRQLTQRVKRILKRSVSALAQQIREGLFEPLGYEIGFGPNEKLPPIVIELDKGRRMVMTGRIDRVDIMESDGKVYTRITDYKSSEKDISLSDLYYGIQLQLPMYIDAFVKSSKRVTGKDYVPAGMFYFHINDPVVNALPSDSIERISELISEGCSLRGMILDDERVYRAMDKDLVIDEKTRAKDIHSIFRAAAVSSSDFDTIRQFVNNAARDIGNEITKGSVKTEPLISSGVCNYCPYGGICRYAFGKGSERKEDCNSRNAWEKIRQRNEELK